MKRMPLKKALLPKTAYAYRPGRVAAVLLLGVALAGCAGTTTSMTTATRKAPQTAWQVVQSCLKAHPLFDLNVNGSNIGVLDQFRGFVANLQDDGTSRAARADVEARNAYSTGPSDPAYARATGPVLYQFTPGSSAQNRSDVTACVEEAYAHASSAQPSSAGGSPAPTSSAQGTESAAASPAPTVTSGAPAGSGTTRCDPNIYAGPSTSCPFAANVFKAVAAGYKQGGQIPGQVTTTSPATGRSYSLSCVIDSSQLVECSTPGAAALVTFSVRSVEMY